MHRPQRSGCALRRPCPAVVTRTGLPLTPPGSGDPSHHRRRAVIAWMGVEPVVSSQELDRVVAFHGHLCPGLALGIRVAEIALRELGPRAADEELVAVVESQSCALDAIQFLLGCTLGKGNLLILDRGKPVFTLARRSDGRAIRVAARPGSTKSLAPDEEELLRKVGSSGNSEAEGRAFQALWRERALAVLAAEEGELFEVRLPEDFVLPDRASLSRSVRCDACGELVAASHLLDLDGRSLCLPCAQDALSSRMLMRPVGTVYSELGPHRSSRLGGGVESAIVVDPRYLDGLLGIKVGSRLEILFYLDRAPREGVSLRQHPMGDRSAPVRGVFALRSPHRPNPIGLTTVTVRSVEGSRLIVTGLDAWDQTPVLDIKPHVGP